MDGTKRSPDTEHGWHALEAHFHDISQRHMRDMFAADPQRFERYSLRFNDILLDYSKNLIDEETLELLMQLAEESGLEDWRRRLFAGEPINHTEQRAVLHPALRAPLHGSTTIDLPEINATVHHELDRIAEISEAVRSRRWRGITGQPITDVVNIGIGGSDLGPRMVTEALHPYAVHDLRSHFVSNLDENLIHDTLEDLKPETTLFIVSSKSFRTVETIVNAETAIEWFRREYPGEEAMHRHFLAVTTNRGAAQRLGIPEENVLRIWDWVGGRYSLWSAIGLPIAIAVGMDNFRELLRGAYEMDQHFLTAPMKENMPVILALLGIWYNNFFHAQTHAILPYDEHMGEFPDYLQQADMESNGKCVDRDGLEVRYSTGPIIFGGIGNKGQHAFYQLLHQGTKMIPCDFLAPITDFSCIMRHHRPLMANVFAQTKALMEGRNEQQAREQMQNQGMKEDDIRRLLPYKVFKGNKPTNTILFRTLDPKTLGSLIALYEHKVFVQGVIWNLNSFDQWGVELGKELAGTIGDDLNDDEPVGHHDSSTNGLINYYKNLRPKG
jgi:glucose-6-phosphate isomerase